MSPLPKLTGVSVPMKRCDPDGVVSCKERMGTPMRKHCPESYMNSVSVLCRATSQSTSTTAAQPAETEAQGAASAESMEGAVSFPGQSPNQMWYCCSCTCICEAGAHRHHKRLGELCRQVESSETSEVQVPDTVRESKAIIRRLHDMAIRLAVRVYWFRMINPICCSVRIS